MKRLTVFFSIFILIAVIPLMGAKKKENCLVKINDYCMTSQEFEGEFKDSVYVAKDTPAARSEFLDTLIRRKLMVRDAERLGLDKDKEFLKTVERFWEQSLLKRYLNQKSKKISSSILVTDQEVLEEYKRMQKIGIADKPYVQMYDQIKPRLVQMQETKAMDAWLAQLYGNAGGSH